MKWVTTLDDNVRSIWRCEDEECECDKYDCIISPTFYQDNGTPLCECGQDMDYIETQIDMEHV